MKKIILTILLLQLSFYAHAKKFDPPKIKIEKAIEMAKAHTREKYTVFPKNYLLTEVTFKNIFNEYQEAYWSVKWHRMPRVKGAWFQVRVYNSGKVELYHGK